MERRWGAWLAFHVLLAVVDLVWLVGSYPPFDLMWEASLWRLSVLEVFVLGRTGLLLVMEAIFLVQGLRKPFGKSVGACISGFLLGAALSWAIIVLFGGYLLSTLRENLLLAILLSTECFIPLHLLSREEKNATHSVSTSPSTSPWD